MEKLFCDLHQKFGDLTTRKGGIIFFGFGVVFVALIFISFYFQIRVSSDTLFWVFSTIAQSLVALVALMGMVGIFKLQAINRDEERIVSSINQDFFYFTSRLPIGSIEEIHQEIEEILKENKKPNDWVGYKKIEKAYSKLKNLKWLREIIIEKSGLEFIIYTILLVGMNIILLAFSSIINQYYLGLPFLFFAIFLSLYSLFLTIKFVAEGLLG